MITARMKYKFSSVFSLVLLLAGLATSVWLVQQESSPRSEARQEKPVTTPAAAFGPDLNQDGLVDQEDLKLWQRYYEEGDMRADLNQDGKLDFSEDLDIIRQQLQ